MLLLCQLRFTISNQLLCNFDVWLVLITDESSIQRQQFPPNFVHLLTGRKEHEA